MRRLLKPAPLAALILLAWLVAYADPVAQARQSWRLAAVTAGQVQQWEPRIARMIANGELRLRSITDDALLPGVVHERLDQEYRGVPVVGADLTREIDGRTVSIFGQLYAGIDVDVTPSLTADDARDRVLQATGIAPSADREPRLVVLPTNEGGFDLAYEIHAGSAARFMVYFVDAHTGMVLLETTDLRTQMAAVGQGTGVLGDAKKMSASPLGGVYAADDRMRPPQLITYDMKGNLTRANQILDGIIRPIDTDKATDADNVWTDGAAVDAHTYLGWTYDYYYVRLNRRGLDDNSAPMLGIVHPVRREGMLSASLDDFGTYYVNAFWCGGCGATGPGMMVFGEGMMSGYYLTNGQYVDYLAASLDVVGHELSHGVIDYSSRLAYRNESGALNEAFADIMGTSVEFFRQPRAADVMTGGNTTMTADYVVGEDSFRGARGASSGVRSLANPAAFGDPDHYSRRRIASGPASDANDWGYVHTNSTIAGHAFFLAVEGGTNRTSGVTVTGVGDKNRDQIEKAFYRAFVYKLASSATFSAARIATIQAAREISGAGSLAEQAITQAWNAVGVTDTSSNTATFSVPDDVRSRTPRLLRRDER